ncbi:contact-dependent growth inhibition system immunity protein [Luteimicrobium sp. DT211]|uniref:contact-dependent growth inhibition system immunity protein n=1 Tax=Luteimicrobium sp. DT211 TaxID=3393412 RepID=UPI003CEEFC97
MFTVRDPGMSGRSAGSTQIARLRYLADCYFHQDWDTYAATPLGVVGVFCETEPQESVDELKSELKVVLAGDPTEQDLGALWSVTCRAVWTPTDSGVSNREWFDAMERAVG